MDSKMEAKWPAPGLSGAIWHYIRVHWYYFVSYFFGNWWVASKPVSKFNHKVVFIGDGVAAGYGDYLTCVNTPGVVRHVDQRRRAEPSIRLNWKFLNCGVLGSTSDEWHPECKSPLSPFRSYGLFWGAFDKYFCRRRKPIFRQIFDDAKFNDAEIVVLCVGLNDSKYGGKASEPKHTVENISAICKELRSRDKTVIVNTIPLRWRLKESTTNDIFKQDSDRNSFIAQYINSLNDKRVILGADLGSGIFNNTDFYTADAIHFDSTGYRRFARELQNTLFPAMVRVEVEKCYKPYFANGESN
mmetsp:Transcript_1181/g.1654  ORF Transcript_1181/g.1654 Transcript_1181/m.1654 type:complete len:300 (+) Transcript_1181:1-900(+)